jgi:hypothetical protein
MSDTTKRIIVGFTLFQACVINVIFYKLLRLGIAVISVYVMIWQRDNFIKCVFLVGSKKLMDFRC